MGKNILRTTGICGLLLAAVFCVIDWRVSAGIILGMICFIMYFIILNASFSDLSELKGSDAFMMILASVVRMILMAAPVLAGVMMPQYFNTWGCLGGFVIFKAAAVIEAARNSKNT